MWCSAGILLILLLRSITDVEHDIEKLLCAITSRLDYYNTVLAEWFLNPYIGYSQFILLLESLLSLQTPDSLQQLLQSQGSRPLINSKYICCWKTILLQNSPVTVRPPCQHTEIRHVPKTEVQFENSVFQYLTGSRKT